MTLMSAQVDRAAGVLLAAAAGDALGIGYEYTHPTADQPITMIGGDGFEPGEWTDDTAMTVAIAEVTATGLDLRTEAGLDAVAAGFLRWYATEPEGVGAQTRKVLGRGDRTGAAMRQTAAALGGRAAGNGSLMRTAPVALAYLNDPVARGEAAVAVSRLTHADPRAGEACQIWCHLIADAVVTGDIDLSWTFLGKLGPGVEAFWRPRKETAETGTPADFPDNGWVVHALQTAWYAVTHTTGQAETSLVHGLELAVRAGHDTDTTACIAGALLGARWGASAVPEGWKGLLHGWPGLRGDDLVRLAVETVRHRS